MKIIKKSLPCLLILFSLYSYASGKTDLEERNLKGNVKSIEMIQEITNDGYSETYTINYIFNTDKKLESIQCENSEGENAGTVKCIYDATGLLTNRKVDHFPSFPCEPLSNEYYDKTFKYNSTGKLTESYDALNKTRTTFTYNAKGQLIKENYKESSGSGWKAYKYDAKGNITNITFNTGIRGRYFSYNAKNQLIEECVDGFYCITFKYNEKGDVIESVYEGYIDEPKKKTYSYQYDTQGNWIKQTTTEKGKITSTITREIVYY